jgi:replicative DNA helicase
VNDQGPLANPEKLAPNSPEAEEAVLGSILINPDSLLDVLPFLQAADFFIVRNAWIFEALNALFERSENIDNLTLIQELRSRNQLDQIGGAGYITSLINNTPTHVHAETYGRIVANAAIRRRIMAAAAAIAQAALEENAAIETVIETATNTLDAVTTFESRHVIRTGSDILDSAYARYTNWVKEPSVVRGVRMGIPKLDEYIGGMEDGLIVTFYGKTGSGKSTIATHVAFNAAEQTEVHIVATEMSPEFWMLRAVSDLTGIPYVKLKAGYLDDAEQELAEGIWDRIRRVRRNITFHDEGTPSPANVKHNIRALNRRGKAHLVLLDSIQNLITPGVTEDYPQVSLAANMTLELSKMGVITVNTSQTGRNDKYRANKEPELNDASGSGKVENNSWLVIGCHRPRQDDEESGLTDTRVLFIVLKNRVGADMRRIRTNWVAGKGYEHLATNAEWLAAAPTARASAIPVAAHWADN